MAPVAIALQAAPYLMTLLEEAREIVSTLNREDMTPEEMENMVERSRQRRDAALANLKAAIDAAKTQE